MKLSIKNLIFVALMMVVAAGCGKSGGSKGSSSSAAVPSGTNNVLTGNSTGDTAKAALTAWIAAVEPKTTFVAGTIYKDLTDCTKKLLGLISTCQVTQNKAFSAFWPQNSARSFNTSLANILTPEAGYTLASVVQSGTNFTIVFVKQSGSDIEQKLYLVNTNYHAVLQPIDYLYTKNNVMKERTLVKGPAI